METYDGSTEKLVWQLTLLVTYRGDNEIYIKG